jgi:hypothetical protein
VTRQMSGNRRYRTYNATFRSVVLFVWNVGVHPNAVSAAIYPVPIKNIIADPRTSYCEYELIGYITARELGVPSSSH